GVNGQIDGTCGAQRDVDVYCVFSESVQKGFIEIVIVFIPIERKEVIGTRRDSREFVDTVISGGRYAEVLFQLSILRRQNNERFRQDMSTVFGNTAERSS